MKTHSGRTAIALLLTTGALVATAATDASAASLCQVYPTLCRPYNGPRPVGPLGLQGYPGTSPIYTPRQMVPAMPFVVHDALKSLPPAVRQNLYPDSVRNAVRSGAVDRAVQGTMQKSVVPLLGAINGYGPGGAGYTNDAAKAILNGSMSPATAACRAMGGCR
jgi:hypothetical protein